MTAPSTPAVAAVTFPAGASSTAAHDATERQQAARALLLTPLLTASRQPEHLALVRRHAPALKQMFASVLGYQLVTESGFARLIKAPLSADTDPRPALRSTGQEFTPRTYTYLALLCAGLLSGSTGEQVLLSALVEQVRADAVTAGLSVDDSFGESRHLVQAIVLLLKWGVLTETDGTVAAWGARQEEALLDVHRPLLPHLLTGSLTDLTDPRQLLDATGRTAAGPEQPRRSLRRKLVENPLVRREDLTDAERGVLSRERTELTRVLEDNFGLTLEVRAEGALAYDVDGELTDIPFPGTGTVRHVALLLVNALADDLKATADTTVDIGGRTVPGALAPWELVEQNVGLLLTQHGAAFSAQYVEDPARLRTEAIAMLDALSLTRSTPAGLALHPVTARYRPEPHRAPARTRAARRLTGSATGEEPDTLFAATDPATDPTPETR